MMPIYPNSAADIFIGTTSYPCTILAFLLLPQTLYPFLSILIMGDYNPTTIYPAKIYPTKIYPVYCVILSFQGRVITTLALDKEIKVTITFD